MSTELTDVPLTPQQRRMIVLHEIDADNVAYHNVAAFRLRGEVDAARLRAAIESVVSSHQSLLTCFSLQAGVPTAWQRRSARLDWVEVDLRHEADAERAGIALLRARAAERMDLKESALRGALVRVADDVWLLAVVIHHIVSDAWSFGVFFRDLGAAYDAVEAGPVGARRARRQYPDYARWLGQQLQRPAYARAVAHFAGALAGAPHCLELPWDRGRPALQSYRGATTFAPLSPELVAAVNELAERQQVTPFVVFHSAFALLLRRYSNQRDLVIGVPVASRGRPEFEDTVGFFVNTLPLRSRLDDEASFVQLLDATRALLSDALDHQMAQIEDIIEALRLPRDASYPPIYQVLFSYQSASSGEPAWGGMKAQRINLGMPGARYDVSLSIEIAGSGGVAAWEYNTDLFDGDTLARMTENYAHALERLVAAPDAPLADVDILCPRQRQRQLAAAAVERMAYPATTLNELIRQQALTTPDAPALLWRLESWTYRRLLDASDGIARRLVGAGVRRGDVVAVLCERTPGLVAALLGVWRAGAAYVPLDPTYPADRIAFMLADSEASVLLVGAGDVPFSVPGSVAVVELDGAEPRPEPLTEANQASPGDRAYIIYTSGSTGRPKGVAIEHRSVVAFLAWAHREYSRDELARVLAATSICFDLSVFELFAPLTMGGSAVLVRDALELAELEDKPRVTLLNIVHSAMAELLRLEAVPPTARIVNFGGELPANEVAQQSYALGHVERVYNVYGPTEDTVYSMSYRIPRGAREVPAIGRSIPNSQAFVLDERRRLVPSGVVGELYLAGDGLAREYHHRPELTAERFVEVDVGGPVRAYRTGDLARHDSQGVIHFLGRIDHQVKLRGYRIELGEVDQAMMRAPGVREAVAIVWASPAGERLLVGYCVGDVAVDELRTRLGEWLPAYMVPSHLVHVERLPKTPNGKIDRARLPAPALQAAVGVAPRDGTLEPRVARVFEELLGHAAGDVGADADFFALGGHSLLAARTAARLSAELGVDVKIRDIFRYPRVRELSSELASREVERAPAPAAAPAERVLLAEFPGYHVNCFYHCVIQSLNYFDSRPIHELNDLAAAFLGYHLEYRTLDPARTLSPVLYREVVCSGAQPLEQRLLELFGIESQRFHLDGDAASIQAVLQRGGWPILVGGTLQTVEPSRAIIGWDEASARFTALGNDFGVGLEYLALDSQRLRAGEQVLALYPARSRDAAGSPLVRSWGRHLDVRQQQRARDERAFTAWLDKYGARTILPEKPLLCTELEGVNVTIGSELSGFLRFEQYVIHHLPAEWRTPSVAALAALIDQTLGVYQHQTNKLRRALLTADTLDASALNQKITDALKVVLERQRALAAARSGDVAMRKEAAQC